METHNNSTGEQAQNNPSGSQAQNELQIQNKPTDSSVKKSSSAQPKNSENNFVQKSSKSAAVQSNKLTSSLHNLNNDFTSHDKFSFTKIIIFLIIGIAFILCIIWICSKRKKKEGYFYDENGNPEEKAKVVYIK